MASINELDPEKHSAAMTERKSRADFLFLLPDETMASVVVVLDMLEKRLGGLRKY